MAISKLGFATLVALLNIDFWAWDKPTTFGPDSCSTGLLEAWTLPSRETRPSALRFVGMERHGSETNSSDLLKTLENMKKTKGLIYWGWNKKTPQAKPGFACWGARWALYWQKSITTGYPAHSFACFSILQLSPNAPLDALWKPLTNATRNIKYFIDIEMYRNVTKSQHLKTDIKRQGSARRKASWLLVESLRWKECWWIRGCFHLCDHSANLPERIDELPVISALPLRKSHETTTERLNFQEETIVHINIYT